MVYKQLKSENNRKDERELLNDFIILPGTHYIGVLLSQITLLP